MKDIVITRQSFIKRGASLWMDVETLGRHLGYKDPHDAIKKIYTRNQGTTSALFDEITLKAHVTLLYRDLAKIRLSMHLARYRKLDEKEMERAASLRMHLSIAKICRVYRMGRRRMEGLLSLYDMANGYTEPAPAILTNRLKPE